MSSSASTKKFRMIHVRFGDRTIEVKMQKSVNKWKGNRKMFKRLITSIKTEFQLKTPFQIYDPNVDMFIDDIDDLCGCYIGYGDDYNFALRLHVKLKPLNISIKTKDSKQTLQRPWLQLDHNNRSPFEIFIHRVLSQWFRSYPFEPNDVTQRHNFLFGIDCITIIKSYTSNGTIASFLDARKVFHMAEMNRIQKSKILVGVEYKYSGSDGQGGFVCASGQISWELTLFTEDNKCKYYWTYRRPGNGITRGYGRDSGDFRLLSGDGTFVIVGDHVNITYTTKWDGTKTATFSLDKLVRAPTSGYGFKYLF
eukprot:171752_1